MEETIDIEIEKEKESEEARVEAWRVEQLAKLGLSGYDVVGQAGEATTLLELVREHRPDLAIVDIRMPPDHSTEGLRAARAIREESPETAILVLSAYVEVKHATTLLESGQRSGYLLKSRVANIDEFLESIDRLSRGGSVIDPSLVV